MNSNKKYLVTGAAGFIGFYLSKALLEQGLTVMGIDSLNEYYDVNLKLARLEILKNYENFKFIREDISDKQIVMHVFDEFRPHVVINLAAQAGVRYSVENPNAYINSNIVGFYNILEACRHYPVKHLLYASSSSVYGGNSKIPFEEKDFTDHPLSLYAATKKSNELMAYTYSHLYRIPSTGLRFFTVYGPMGRPDMSYYDFTNRYFSGKPVRIFNNGDFINDLYRDFTYVDDVIEGILRLVDYPPVIEGRVPNRIYNIGNNHPERLMDFVRTLENCLSTAMNKEVVFDKIFEPMKTGDVPATYASTELLDEAVGFKPRTSIEEGLKKFAEWYVEYYRLK